MQIFSRVLPLLGKMGLAGALLSNGAFALQRGPHPSRGVHSGGNSYLVSADFMISADFTSTASPLETGNHNPNI